MNCIYHIINFAVCQYICEHERIIFSALLPGISIRLVQITCQLYQKKIFIFAVYHKYLRIVFACCRQKISLPASWFSHTHLSYDFYLCRLNISFRFSCPLLRGKKREKGRKGRKKRKKKEKQKKGCLPQKALFLYTCRRQHRFRSAPASKKNDRPKEKKP